MIKKPDWIIRPLENPTEMEQLEELQRAVWPGSETDIVPSHLLLTVAHNGGLVLGAFVQDRLVGMVFGFAGIEKTADGFPRPKHCSHQAGVLPEYRDSGLGYALKCAQRQKIQQQGLDHITWTYDPLLSRNAYLNVAKLGGVCNTYKREVYGAMRDGLNTGLPSDRFQVDWWLSSRHVEEKLMASATRKLPDFIAADINPLYAVSLTTSGLIVPPEGLPHFEKPAFLVEIPSDFSALKAADLSMAAEWRLFTRAVFESAFAQDYLVTDFVFDNSAERPRSFYALSIMNTNKEEQ